MENVKNDKGLKNSKSHAHLQIIMKHSTKFLVSSIKDVAGVAGTKYESARAIKWPKQKSEATCTSSYDKKAIYKIQISPMKDVRGVSGARSDGRKDEQNVGRTHTRTDEVHFYSPHPVWQHTFVSPSAFSRRAVVSYCRKYVHEVLVNRLGGLSLARKKCGKVNGPSRHDLGCLLWT